MADLWTVMPPFRQVELTTNSVDIFITITELRLAAQCVPKPKDAMNEFVDHRDPRVEGIQHFGTSVQLS